MKHLVLIIFLCLSIKPIHAQDCGHIPTTADDIRIHENLKHLEHSKNNDVIYVPVQFIIVSNQFGDGAVAESEVVESLCLLNNYFDTIGIRFYMHDNFKYIINQDIYAQESLGSSGVVAQFLANKVAGAINVFIGGELGTGNSGYYTSNADVIYMDKRYVNGQDVILAHEMGHFFSLRHTFYGWEDTTYNPSAPTPTQIFYRGAFRQVELVDRAENCAIAADLLCDTPSDYITDWNGGCNYTGGAVDPNGVPIDPDERNIMAYYSFSGCSEYIFSREQIDLMLTDLNRRSNIMVQDSVEDNPVASAPVLEYPLEDELVFELENANFEWSEVQGADYYVFELSFVPNFVTTISSIYTSDNSITIDGLFNNFTYYWRVSAVSFLDPCNPVQSAVYRFETDNTASTEFLLMEEFQIKSNPVSDILEITGNTNKLDYASVIDESGASLLYFKSGVKNVINVEQLDAGLYYLIIGTKEHKRTLRFVKI